MNFQAVNRWNQNKSSDIVTLGCDYFLDIFYAFYYVRTEKYYNIVMFVIQLLFEIRVIAMWETQFLFRNKGLNVCVI